MIDVNDAGARSNVDVAIRKTAEPERARDEVLRRGVRRDSYRWRKNLHVAAGKVGSIQHITRSVRLDAADKSVSDVGKADRAAAHRRVRIGEYVERQRPGLPGHTQSHRHRRQDGAGHIAQFHGTPHRPFWFRLLHAGEQAPPAAGPAQREHHSYLSL